MNCKGDEDVDAKRSRPSIGKPGKCHARKERVLLVGTDQWITSGPAATTAAFKGRIHGCTRTFRESVRFFSLAPRAPSIHGTTRTQADPVARPLSARADISAQTATSGGDPQRSKAGLTSRIAASPGAADAIRSTEVPRVHHAPPQPHLQLVHFGHPSG